MSMLVKLQKKDRMHNGYVHRIGSVIKLPNSLALALMNKGFAIVATGQEHAEDAKVRSEKRKAGKAERAQKKGGKR